MGIRFNKSINLGKGVRLNISKSGIGISAGKTIGNTSVRVGRTAKGKTRVTGTLKGTGVSYVKEFTDPVTQAVKDKEKEKKKASKQASSKKKTEVVEETSPVTTASAVNVTGKMTTSQRLAAKRAAEEQAQMEAAQQQNTEVVETVDSEEYEGPRLVPFEEEDPQE